MNDYPERAIREAEGWLASAREKLHDVQDEPALANVCCALAIHAIIRANDALSLKHLGIKGTRHDDLAAVFAKLIREGKLPKSDERFGKLLVKAAGDKSGADYGKKEFSYEDAEEYVENAEEFVDTVRSRI
ncbi:MAG: HEPN domain-containing protein [Candidatus Micrarchaeota archaeon]